MAAPDKEMQNQAAEKRKPETEDEKKAAKRVVKRHPLEDKRLAKQAEKYFRSIAK